MARHDDRFLVDAMLGSLATYLRMCGYDAAFALDEGRPGGDGAGGVADDGDGRGQADDGATEPTDDELRRWACAEDRRLVTRDRDLAARTAGAILLRTRDVVDQLRELRDAGIELSLPSAPVRCGRCNGRLDPVDPDEPTPEYAPDPATVDVRACANCDSASGGGATGTTWRRRSTRCSGRDRPDSRITPPVSGRTRPRARGIPRL